MNVNCFILKVQNKDDRDVYVKTIWDTSSFELWLLAEDSIWNGTCSASDIESNSVDYLLKPDSYYSNAKTCLTTKDVKHRYELQHKGDTHMFLWKIWNDKENRMRICGSLKVEVYPEHSMEGIKNIFLDYLINQNNELKGEIHKSTESNGLLRVELTKTTDDLQRMVELKDEMESSLYSKFSLLLNTKKRRIQLLEKLLKSDE